MRIVRAVGLLALGLVALLAVIGAVHDPDPSPLPLPRAVVTIDGTPISYHQTGLGADVVLVHGGMGSAEDFDPVLPALAARYRVTAIDRPGFGRSGSTGDDPTYPGNARLLAGAMRQLGLSEPILVGHSHGGGVALAIAETFPDLPGGLVLLAPAWFPGGAAAFIDRLGALPFVGEGLMATVGAVIAPGMIEATVRKALQPDDAKSSTTFVTDRQRRFNVPRSLTVHSRQQVTDAAGLTEIAARLGAVRVPSVIIGCAQDAFEGAELDSRRLARELPGATLEWLEGCGHYVQVGRPDVVIGAVARLRATAEPSRP